MRKVLILVVLILVVGLARGSYTKDIDVSIQESLLKHSKIEVATQDDITAILELMTEQEKQIANLQKRVSELEDTVNYLILGNMPMRVAPNPDIRKIK